MSRGSFSRTVARAAASGGSRSYRGRRPVGWYLALVLICAVGLFLIVYSRNERIHPANAASKPTVGPTASDHWHAALAIDICGQVLPNLPANTNLAVGLRTFGDGLIDIDPGAAKTPSDFDGAKATLGLFASTYPSFSLTSTSIHVPGAGQKTWTNGKACPASHGTPGAGLLQVRVWSSLNAKPTLVTTAATTLALKNGQLITLAFVPKSDASSIPEPNATTRASLAAALGVSTTQTTLGPSSSASTSTTAPVATSTTKAK